MKFTALRVTVAGLILVPLVSACAAVGGQPVGVRQPVRTSVGASEVGELDIALLEASFDAQDVSFLLERAEDVLLVDCMADRGYEFIPIAFDGTPRERVLLPYVLSVEEAKAEGYSEITEVAGAALPEGFNDQVALMDELSASERDSYDEAFWGPDEKSGCLGEARDSLVDSHEQMRLLVNQLQGAALQVESSLLAHPQVRALQDEWSACIQGRGYNYDKPQDAVDAMVEQFGALGGPGARGEDSAVAPQEVRTATEDAICQEQVGFEQVNALRADIDSTFAADMDSVIEAWSRVRPGILDHVTELLGDERVNRFLGER